MQKAKTRPKITISKFQAADYLKSKGAICEFLAAALEEPDPDYFVSALREAVKARGVAMVGRRSGLSRESIRTTLAPGAKPHYATICKLVDALGARLTVKAA
jgi:probable addiction module antidote protein